MPDTPTPPPVLRTRRAARLQAKVKRFAEPGDHLVAWMQGWVSRDGGAWHKLLAARTLDFVVLTERELLLISTGFFTQRPRRLVFAAPLSVLRIVDSGEAPGRRLHVSRPRHRSLRIEMDGKPEQIAFGLTLRERGITVPAPPTPGSQATP
jgi:hypothetical protein